MATYKHLDEEGLSQVWSKAINKFADKETTETELNKKFELPSGGTEGQVLTKTGTGTEWADVSSENDETELVNTFLFGSLWAEEVRYGFTFDVASSNNVSVSGMTCTFSVPGTYLLSIIATSSIDVKTYGFKVTLPNKKTVDFGSVRYSGTSAYWAPNPFYISFDVTSSNKQVKFENANDNSFEPAAYFIDIRRIA